jgi:hypothetical protein
VSRPGRERLVFLAGLALYFGVLWYLWWSPVLYPLKVFVVFLHEISHGIASVATGGSIEQIRLSPLLGGACFCPGGNAFLTLSSGYLGSLAWGALMVEGARWSGRRPAGMLRVFGFFVSVLTLLYVRGIFGIAFGLLFGLALVYSAARLSTQLSRTLLTVLGLTSCLYALLDIKGDILDRPELRSDASVLAELTGIPTLVWGALWICAAIAASGWLLARAYRAKV